jgi:hypothetical protein
MKIIPMTIMYADRTMSHMEILVEAVSEFIRGLVPEAARMRRRDRACAVTISISPRNANHRSEGRSR